MQKLESCFMIFEGTMSRPGTERESGDDGTHQYVYGYMLRVASLQSYESRLMFEQYNCQFVRVYACDAKCM